MGYLHKSYEEQCRDEALEKLTEVLRGVVAEDKVNELATAIDELIKAHCAVSAEDTYDRIKERGNYSRSDW